MNIPLKLTSLQRCQYLLTTNSAISGHRRSCDLVVIVLAELSKSLSDQLFRPGFTYISSPALSEVVMRVESEQDSPSTQRNHHRWPGLTTNAERGHRQSWVWTGFSFRHHRRWYRLTTSAKRGSHQSQVWWSGLTACAEQGSRVCTGSSFHSASSLSMIWAHKSSESGLKRILLSPGVITANDLGSQWHPHVLQRLACRMEHRACQSRP